MRVERTLPALRLGYRPGLDGVRAVAIGAVVAWHAGLQSAPHLGSVGVTVFFTLSGFLITSLLREEWTASNRIALGAFYLRRGLRLLPALIVMLAVVTLLRPEQLGNAGWALSYLANWPLATGHDLGLFEHAWSLSIEEQFYLAWPIALIGLLTWAPRRAPTILGVAIAGLVVARFAIPVEPRTFIGFSTIAHAPSLLIGALAALITLPILPRGHAVAVGLAGIGLAAILPGEVGVRWADPLAAGMTLFLIAAAMQGALAAQPLVALGRVSYGLYLWHWPILLMLGAGSGERGPWWSLGGVSLALLATATSWYLVERPALGLKRRLRPREPAITDPDATRAAPPSGSRA